MDISKIIDNVVVVDTETTGIDPFRCGLLQVGAVKLTDENVSFQANCRVAEGKIVSIYALYVNGTNLHNLNTAGLPTPSSQVVVTRFLMWCKKNNLSHMAGFNVGKFDWHFLREGLAQLGSDDFRVDLSSFDLFFSHRLLEINSVAFGVLGKMLSSAELPKVLGVKPEPEPHDALEGAKLGARVLNKLIKKFCEKA